MTRSTSSAISSAPTTRRWSCAPTSATGATALCWRPTLPGFKKDDIKIDLENDRLTIKAERRSESENKANGYVRRERKLRLV